MSKRPDFTIAQVTEQFDVSRSTVRRGLAEGRFPGAKKDQAGRWVIPIDDILQAGFKPRKTWFNEQSHEPAPDVGHEQPSLAQSNNDAVFSELTQLQNELAHERAQVDKLKALLEAEQEHVNSLRMALRMIEGNSSAASRSQPDSPSDTSRPTDYARRIDEPPRQIAGVFSRLFRRR